MRIRTEPSRVVLPIAAALFLLASCDRNVPSEPSFGASPVASTPHDVAGCGVLPEFPCDARGPGAINDFEVWSTNEHGAHVVFMGIDDGTGQPAQYQFRFYLSGSWETGTVATDVQCTTLPGSGLQSCNVNGMGARQSWTVQARPYRVSMLIDTIWGPPSVALFAHTPPVNGANVVTNMRGVGSGDDYVEFSFRAVADSDGTQTPARYRMRMMPTPLSWNAATQVTTGTCSGDPPPPLVVDSVYTCRITGLQPGTSYQVQLYTRRVRPGLDDVYGDLSNIATAVTTGSQTP